MRTPTLRHANALAVRAPTPWPCARCPPVRTPTPLRALPVLALPVVGAERTSPKLLPRGSRSLTRHPRPPAPTGASRGNFTGKKRD